jgi:uncharacterized membrane protein
MVKSIIRRIWNNFFIAPWTFQQHFTPAVARTLQSRVSESEKRHSAELKVAIEENLSFGELIRSVNPRDKAHQVFSKLQVWDTECNNGVLLYMLLSEHRIEIVTDRAVTRLKLDDAFRAICTQLEKALVSEQYVMGVQKAIDDISELLAEHFPPSPDDKNEVTDSIEFVNPR